MIFIVNGPHHKDAKIVADGYKIEDGALIFFKLEVGANFGPPKKVNTKVLAPGQWLEVTNAQ